jgi:hypothetical protein
VGDEVAEGEAIRTAAGARAELRLGSERTARVYERSLLRVRAEADAGVRSIDLDEGASLFDLVRRAAGDLFDVRTPEIIVSVKGTRFLVSAAAGPDSASVFRGEVELAAPGFDALAVYPGFTGALGEVMSTPFADPWETWAVSFAAPEIAIEDGAGELREAIDAARAEKEHAPRPVPAAKDDGADSEARRGRLESKGPGDALDPGKLEANPLDSHEGKGSRGEGQNQLDPVLDVLGEGEPDTTSGSALLDAVLGAEPGDLPRGTPQAGGGGGGFSGGPGGASTPFPFVFDVQTSGGPNTVTVGFGAESVTLDQNQVDTLRTGDLSPLGSFGEIVTSLGVDPSALGDYLDSLI